MGLLDVLLRKVLKVDGEELIERKTWTMTGATIVDNPVTKETEFTFTSGGESDDGTGNINNSSTGPTANVGTTISSVPVKSVRFTGVAPVVSGFASPTNARRMIVMSTGGPLILANDDIGSTAGNRILTGTGEDLEIAQNRSALLTYDLTSLRWRVGAVDRKIEASGDVSVEDTGFNGGIHIRPVPPGFINPKDSAYGAVGNGSTDDSAALILAVAVGTTDIHFPPGTYKVSNNVTFPATQTLHFARGALLSVDSGKTVKILGHVDAGVEQHVFGGAGKVFLPGTGVIHVGWFGAIADADFSGGGTDNAPFIEAAIEAVDSSVDKIQSAVIQFACTPGKAYKLAGKVHVRRSAILRGHGGGQNFPGTLFLCEPGVTGFRVFGADDLTACPSGAPDVVCEDFTVRSRGQDVTSTTCDYDATDDVFSVSNVTDPSSFSVGQNIMIDGCGRTATLATMTAATTIGVALVTMSTTGDRWMPGMGDLGGGDGAPAGMLEGGWWITVPGAYDYPTRVVSVAGTNSEILTMAAAASGTVTGVPVRWRAPILAMITSIAGSTIAFDAYGASTGESFVDLIMTAGAGRPVRIRHADCGIDIGNKVKIRNVSVGGYAVQHGFSGPAFAVRGDHANAIQSTGVNGSSIENCDSYHNRHAMFVIGADSNNCKFSVQSQRSWDWSYVEASHLGNYYSGTHGDGSHGIVGSDIDGNESVFDYPYTEGGTANSFGPAHIWFGLSGAHFQGGTGISRGIIEKLQFSAEDFTGTQVLMGGPEVYARFKRKLAAGGLVFAPHSSNQDTGKVGWNQFSHDLRPRNHPLMFADDDQSEAMAGTLWLPHDFMLGDDSAFNTLDATYAARIASIRSTAEGAVIRDPRQGYFDSGNSTSTGMPAWQPGDWIRDANLLDGCPTRHVIEAGHRAIDWKPGNAAPQYSTVCPTIDNHSGSYFINNGTAGTTDTTEPDWTTAPALGNTVVDNDVTWTNAGDAAYLQPSELGGYIIRAITTSETWAQTDRHFLCGSVEVTGSLSADATLTLPAGRYSRWLWNHTTGGHDLVVKCASGNTVRIPYGLAALVQCTGSQMTQRGALTSPAGPDWSGAWDADYAGSPWVGLRGRLLGIDPTADAVATPGSTAQGGYQPATFTAGSSQALGHASLGAFVTLGAGTIAMLVYVPSTAGTAGVFLDPALFAESNAASLILSFSTSGAQFGLYDGAQKSITQACATGGYHLIVARWDGANINLRVDGTDATPVAAGACAAMAGFFLGKNPGVAFATFRLLSFRTAKYAISAADLTALEAEYNDKFGVSV